MKMDQGHLNTLIVPVYWETLEPEEGSYDFSLVDSLLEQAVRFKKKLILLWFGLWKNTESAYVPAWMKQDSETFFRAEMYGGERLNTIFPKPSGTHLEKSSLDPWVSRWEQAMVRALLTPDEKKKYFFKFNVDGLLRGDYQSRMNGYATARQNGWMSANDIRELENLDRIPAEQGGDLYLINGNMTKLEDAGIFAAGNNGKEEGDSDEEVLELEKQEDQRSGFRRRGK